MKNGQWLKKIVPYNKGNAIAYTLLQFGVKNVIRFTKFSFILQFHRTWILPNQISHCFLS